MGDKYWKIIYVRVETTISQNMATLASEDFIFPKADLFVYK